MDVEYYTEDGNKKRETFHGFVAIIDQHEIDHLNGVIFLDRIADGKTLMSGNEYKKLK